MFVINSQRAQNLIDKPVAIISQPNSQMKRYPSEAFKVWVDLSLDENRVKKLSFAGELSSLEKLVLESLASLMTGKALSIIDNLSIRECEAFLRDRNSQVAFEGVDPEAEGKFKKFFTWLKGLPFMASGEDYQFDSQKGAFARLKLVEKVRELKAFLASKEVLTLYQNHARPELVDVDDLTVYVQVPYHTDTERSLFEELHILGVEAFQDENLNFIPEA